LSIIVAGAAIFRKPFALDAFLECVRKQRS
jgi:hypothetical protein